MIVLCLGTIAWAGSRANAAWHYFAAQAIAEPLFENGNGDAEAFEASENHISTALQRFPANPDYLDFAGRLMILRSNQPGVVGGERRELLESAAENFRQALNTRPLWPYSWVNLLAAKDKLGQVDPEFKMALNRAVELGPWEPRVQMQVVDSGLRYWSKLGSDERALVQRKFSDAFRVQPRDAFALVRDYGRPDLVCNLQDQHARIRQWCADVLAEG